MFAINTANLAWFARYLNGRKCGVPQGLIGPLLFLLYVNDLRNYSNVLIVIMLGDDTNFFEHSNTNTLFKTVNDELNKINKWFSEKEAVTKCWKSFNLRSFHCSMNQAKNTTSLLIYQC